VKLPIGAKPRKHMTYMLITLAPCPRPQGLEDVLMEAR